MVGACLGIISRKQEAAFPGISRIKIKEADWGITKGTPS